MPGVNSRSRHGGRFLGLIVGGGCREIRYRGERKGETVVETTKIRQDRHEFSLPDSRSPPQLNFEGGRITIAREVNEVVSPPLFKNHAAVAIASTAVTTAIELSCGGMQRTTVGVAIRYFGEAATCRRVYVRSAAGPPALDLPALFPTSHVAR
ncbi:hypothetical protein ALC56_10995 [Trachymyrmex septentrionalis]|uniref:Uncharacterized protein n=1 Tax=Trachymyrmex septentrionalis TaxID=34720 RepID=A0A195F215_9HYME|nr:hypothetical protein ALC56_10995 [Trachymyrmex septentrionalis]